MSASPAPFLLISNPRFAAERVKTMQAPAAAAGLQLVRRRPGRHQGQALEVLGHALEYLVDTRMLVYKEQDSRAEGEAIQILSRCSREVFATCPEVVPVGKRLRAWVAGKLHFAELGGLDAPPRKA